MRHLGGETIYLAPQEVGLGEREAIKDVSRVLSRYVDVVAVRTFGQEIVEEYARVLRHPGHQRTDERRAPVPGPRGPGHAAGEGWVAQGVLHRFIGDGNNVAASLVLTATALGMDVRMAAPKGYGLPEDGYL